MVIFVQIKSFKVYMFFIIKCMSLFAIIAFALSLLDYLDPTSKNLMTFMDTHIRNSGILGMFGFMLLSAILSSFFVPRQLLSLVGGYAYGVVLGTLIVTVGVTFGCFLTFVYSRVLLQKVVQRKLGLRIVWMEHLFSKNPFGMALSIRIIPVGSNVILNMIAGVTKIPIVPFCLGSGIGYIPQNFVSALLGTSVRANSLLNAIIAGILYFVGLLVGLWLFKRYKPENTLGIKNTIKSILKPSAV